MVKKRSPGSRRPIRRRAVLKKSAARPPTLLGAGIPMFPPAAFRERRLRLVRTHTYPSGVIELRYERLRDPGDDAKPAS